MSADYTPTLGNYTELKPFRFWCQKVLPLVYDDTLSYYELLCKVVDYLNKTMEDVDTLHEDVEALHAAYVELQGYVNDYFTNLDVQTEINNKLDAMALDGTLVTILRPTVAEEVSTWLEENITPTSPAVDATLLVSGAAADAKVTGDAFKNTRTDFLSTVYNTILGSLEVGGIDTSDGSLSTNVNRARSRLLPLIKNDRVGFSNFSGLWYILVRYDMTGNFVSASSWTQSQTTIQYDGYYRLLFSISNVDDMTDYLDDIEAAFYISNIVTPLLTTSIALSASNYIYYLPDVDNAETNRGYLILLDNSANRPAHLPPVYDDIIFLYTYSQVGSYMASVQLVYSGKSIYRRVYRSGAWQAWTLLTSGRNKVIIDGVTTSFCAGIIAAYELGDCDVYVNKGTYNIKTEMEALFGANIWGSGYSGSDYEYGLPFGNGMKIYGSPGANIVMDGSQLENTDVWDHFSVLMNYWGAGDDQKINVVHGLRFTCTCIRYCIHLDLSAQEVDDTYIIENCDLYLDNSSNTKKTFAYTVGMGASINTIFIIRDCYVYAVTPNDPRDTAYIYFHNTNAEAPNNEIIITGNYIDNGGSIRIDPYGESLNKCKALISNNSLGHAIYNNVVNNNMKVCAWNNEVRT